MAAAAALAVFLLGAPAAHAEEYITVDGSDSILQAGGWNQPAIPDDSLQIQSAVDVEGFYRALVSAIESWNGSDSRISVDISDYGIANDDYFPLYSAFINSHGEYFYLANRMSYSPGSSQAQRAIVFFSDEYTTADIDTFKTRVQQIVGKVDNTWSDEQKALFLHDYLVSHCQYDLTYSRYNAYNALVEKTAVCQGYSEAYDYLLRLVGLKDEVVSSESLNHAWNLATVDGKQYYVDCTWDDPSNLRRPAYVGHKNLLRSKSGIAETDHTSTDWTGTSGENLYEAEAADSSTKYDSYYWSDCTSVIPHIGNLWAYTTPSGIYTHNYSSGADTQLVASVGTWPVVGSSGGYWNGNFSSLASTGSQFVYTDARNVYTVTTSGVKTTKYTLTSSQESQGYIYSLLYNEETGEFDCSWYQQYNSDPAGTISLDLATHVSSVSVSPSSASGELGSTMQLSATVSPSDALNQALTWSSSDESVATVDARGLVSLVGKGKANITAKSQDKGKVGTASITVVGHPLADANITLRNTEGLVYNMQPFEPEITATWGDITLQEGVDYQVEYSNNITAGTAKVTITATEDGDFEGIIVHEFDIAPASLENAAVSVANGAVYDGSAHTPEVVVSLNDAILPSSDYSVSYENNVNAGDAKVVISPNSGNVSGSAEQAFTIAKAPIESATVKTITNTPYTGIAQEPEVAVKLNGKTLIAEDDYEVSYSNNTDAGTAMVTVSGIGNYSSIASTVFDITPIQVEDLEFGVPEAIIYTGKGIEPVEVLLNGSPLPTTDYTISYESNTLPGDATFTFSPITANVVGTYTGAFHIKGLPITAQDITFDAESFTYNGTAQEPGVSIVVNGTNLDSTHDYAVGYEDNVNAGEAAVIIRGEGVYDPTPLSVPFTIAPLDLQDADITVEDATYTGEEQHPSVTVKHDGIEIPSADYTVTYFDNENATNAARAHITPASQNITGSSEVKFTIKPAQLESATVTGVHDEVYNGKEITLEDLSIELDGKTLMPDTDYLVEYRDNTEVGTAYITISGQGNYQGAIERGFEIAKASIDAANVSIGEAKYLGGLDVEPEVSVSVGDVTLDPSEYTVFFADNRNAGEATATITGRNHYEGKIVSEFRIAPASLQELTVEAKPVTYNGKAQKPLVTVRLGAVDLPEDDYLIIWDDSAIEATDSAHFWIQSSGSGNVTGDGAESREGTFSIEPRNIEDAAITLNADTYLYDESEHKPKATVSVQDIGELVEGTDFDAKYDESTKAGSHDILVTGKGNFTGEVSASYEITETKTVTDAAGVSFTYKIEGGKATVVNIEANGATEIVVPKTLEGNADAESQELAVGSVTKEALDGNGQVTSLVVESADTELEKGALEGISPNASVTAPAGSPAAEAAAKHDEAVAGAAANTISAMVSKLKDLSSTEALTAENKQAVADARAAYEALSPAQQKLEAAKDALASIEAAEAKLAELQRQADAAAKEAQDQAAADDASELIGKLPSKVASDADADAVKAAREAYDALTDEQKAKVDPAVVAQLEAAEDSAKEFAAEKEKANQPEKPLAKGTVKVAGSGAAKAKYQVTAAATAKAAGQVAYKQAQTGKAKAASIPATVKIGSYTYKVTSVTANAFKGNASITSIAIGANVAKVGANAFAGCKNLAKVTGGAGVTSIGSGAFKGLAKLASVPKFAKLTTLGANAFNGCKALKSVSIGAKVKAIGKGTFTNCAKLAKVAGAANVATIGDNAFSGCKALKSFTFGAKVTKVGKQAFLDCKKLSTITFKTAKLKSIGAKAFKGTAANITVKAPKAKKAKYKKLLKKAGVSKKAKFK